MCLILGIIPPSGSKTITVMLQPMDGVPADVARHKFMVQTCFCPPGDVDLENIWKVCFLNFIFESIRFMHGLGFNLTIPSSELMYSKLMVVFQQRADDQQVVIREEAPSALASTSPVAINNARSSVSSGGNRIHELEEKLKSEIELRLKSEKERAVLQQDLDDLFNRHRKLQSAATMQTQEGGTPTIQVILLAIAALLIGLIVGKLY
uniref:MSP domain-containing protein n=1 Tax=Angiostrongylus cantonensis TaxID=6313 RepID=A0A0K0DDW0_ANGCA